MMVTGPNATFYAFVGGMGNSSPRGPNKGGFNGGGNSGEYLKNTLITKDDCSGGGGGGTDLRIYDDSINSRIIVASGGSGGSWDCKGAYGGAYKVVCPIANNVYAESENKEDINGNEGVGGQGEDSIAQPGSGGGGGYMGGRGGSWCNVESSSFMAVGCSGSSYISGDENCEPNPSMQFFNTEIRTDCHTGNGILIIEKVFECPQNCISCSNETFCTMCESGYFLSQGEYNSYFKTSNFSNRDSNITSSFGKLTFCQKIPDTPNFNEITRERNLIKMRFNCSVNQGDISIYLSCMVCNVKSYIWFRITFLNEEIDEIIYDQRLIYNNIYKLEYFLYNISYNKETQTLQFNTGSHNIMLMENDVVNNLFCTKISNSTQTPTQTPFETPMASQSIYATSSPTQLPSETSMASQSVLETEQPTESPPETPIESYSIDTTEWITKQSTNDPYESSLELQTQYFSDSSYKSMEISPSKSELKEEYTLESQKDMSSELQNSFESSNYPSTDISMKEFSTTSNQRNMSAIEDIRNKKSNVKLIAIISTVIFVVLIISIVLVVLIIIKKRNQVQENKDIFNEETKKEESLKEGELSKITLNDSTDNDLNFWL